MYVYGHRVTLYKCKRLLDVSVCQANHSFIVYIQDANFLKKCKLFKYFENVF